MAGWYENFIHKFTCSRGWRRRAALLAVGRSGVLYRGHRCLELRDSLFHRRIAASRARPDAGWSSGVRLLVLTHVPVLVSVLQALRGHGPRLRDRHGGFRIVAAQRSGAHVEPSCRRRRGGGTVTSHVVPRCPTGYVYSACADVPVGV